MANQLKSKQAENILHAARQLFAQQGYHGTSTREIARLADTSENTLFRYFERKEDLFWNALRSSLNGLELRRDLLSAIEEGQSPDIVLPQFLRQLFDVTILRPELLPLIGIALIELPWKAPAVIREYISPLLATVNNYVAKSIEAHKLRNADPSLVTAAILASVLGYPALSALIPTARDAYPDTRDAIRAFSKFWIEVLSPPRPDSFMAIAKTDESPHDR